MHAPPESKPAPFALEALAGRGVASWLGEAEGLTVCITGSGRQGAPRELLAATVAAPPAVSWLKQVHSTTLVEARPGLAGEGDALFTRRPGLALAVQTADCVPVVLWGSGLVAVVHAGWRGLRDGILAGTVEALDMAGARALIGPAIGVCCYEVGDDVATAVARTVDDPAVVDRRAERPHLDLPRVAEDQLVAAGIADVAAFRRCTRCSPDLWSYRRDGPGGGRNLTFAWLGG